MDIYKQISLTIFIIVLSLDFIYGQSASSPADFSALDSATYIPFDGNGYMKIGGEVRELYKYYSTSPFGPTGSDSYLLQRYMLSSNLRISNNFRIFGEIKSAIVSFKQGPPSPVDKDKLDLHQLFAQMQLLDDKNFGLALRFGRQEVNYGRMVSTREGPNVRLSFDAVRLMLRSGEWRSEALFAKPVEVDPGIFDDGWLNPEETLWGIRLSRRLNLPFNLKPQRTTLYYLGQHRERAIFAQGIAPEIRHTIGLLIGEPVPLPYGYNIEAAFQWGTFGKNSQKNTIRAWLLAFEGNWLFPEWPLQPGLGLVLQAASGDRDPTDEMLQTFSAPYPSRRLFASTYIGIHSNLYHVQPSISFQPYKKLTVSFTWDFFWRQSTDDAVYAASGRPIPKSTASNAYFIGHQPRLYARLRVGEYLTFGAFYAHFSRGPVLEITNSAPSVNYLALQATLQF